MDFDADVPDDTVAAWTTKRVARWLNLLKIVRPEVAARTTTTLPGQKILTLI